MSLLAFVRLKPCIALSMTRLCALASSASAFRHVQGMTSTQHGPGSLHTALRSVEAVKNCVDVLYYAHRYESRRLPRVLILFQQTEIIIISTSHDVSCSNCTITQWIHWHHNTGIITFDFWENRFTILNYGWVSEHREASSFDEFPCLRPAVQHAYWLQKSTEYRPGAYSVQPTFARSILMEIIDFVDLLVGSANLHCPSYVSIVSQIECLE
jgi:hypothetical protein